MPRHEHTFTINAAPVRVWQVVCDIERWPEWTPSVTSVKRVGDTPAGPGARFDIVQPKLLPARWTVTHWDVGRSFAWESRSPGLQTVGDHVIRPEGGGSAVTLSVALEGPVSVIAALLFGGLTRGYIGFEAEGLKKRCEGA
jgi:uncharacterized membrane protein